MLSDLSDPSFRGAYFETQTEFDLLIDATETPTPKNPIQVPFADSQYAFGFVYTNLWNERLLEIVEGLVSGGIIDMHLDRYTKSKWSLMSNELGMYRNLIGIEHLTFVFQIYVIAGYVAFLVLLGEGIIFLIEIKLKRKMLEYQIELEVCKNYLRRFFGKSSTSNVDNCSRHFVEKVEAYDDSDSD